MPDLLVIVPSRGRPRNIDRLVDAWKTNTKSADLLVALDDDDPATYEFRPGAMYRHDPRRRLGPTLNALALEYASCYKYLGFMGDDHVPKTCGWDLKVQDTLAGLGGVGMCYGNDLLQRDRIPTAVFLTSNIVSTLGFMVPPGMIHLYLDDFWLALGKGLGRITYLPEVIIEHLHPFANKAVMDAGYREVNSTEVEVHDKAILEDYLAHQFLEDLGRLEELLP